MNVQQDLCPLQQGVALWNGQITSRLFGLGEADRNESNMAVTCREEIGIGGYEFLTAVGHRSQNTNVEISLGLCWYNTLFEQWVVAERQAATGQTAPAVCGHAVKLNVEHRASMP